MFQSFDVVLSPPLSIAAYEHDFTSGQNKKLNIDGREVTFIDQLVWPGDAILGALPATVAPIDRTSDGLPIGIHIMGAQFEDRTTIAFPGLMEREFGGFQAPPAGCARTLADLSRGALGGASQLAHRATQPTISRFNGTYPAGDKSI